MEIIWEATPQIVSDYNSKINALQEVPELHENSELRLKTALLDAVNKFMQWMEDNYSALKINGRPRRPRWNVTKLTERMTNICETYGDEYTYEQIFDAVEYLNTCLGNGKRKIKYTAKVPEPKGGDKDIAEQIKFYLYFPLSRCLTTT